MNELEVLSDRLRVLGQQAPITATDPLQDVRRGRVALRRRNARSAAGVTTALVAVGVVAANVGASRLGGDGGSEVAPAGSASGSSAPTSASTQSAGAKDLCSITVGDNSVAGAGTSGVPAPTETIDKELARTPEATAAVNSYRGAAAAILDPSFKHLDADDNKRSDNVQAGFSCDPNTGEYLTRLGTSIGWTGGGALGVVQLEVVSPEYDQKPDAVLAHDGWSPYQGQLPAGVVSARVVDYAVDGGGHAVVVKRTDGLTVAVAASGRWGNNVAPGSPSATDLPAVGQLLTLAASPQLVLPDHASR